LSDAAVTASRIIDDASDAHLATARYEAQNVIDRKAERASTEVESILNYAHSPELRRLVDRYQDLIRAQVGSSTAGLAEQVIARVGSDLPPRPPYATVDTRVPIRTTRGPLDFGLPESRLSEEEAAWYTRNGARLTGDVRFEIANFVDGRRGVTQIRDLVSAEFGPVPQEAVARFLEDLVQVGAMEWAQ
jgi:hypothetical protein